MKIILYSLYEAPYSHLPGLPYPLPNTPNVFTIKSAQQYIQDNDGIDEHLQHPFLHQHFTPSIPEKEVDLSDYRDFVDAVSHIGQFIEDIYNKKRIHSSLGYLTPIEFEAVWSRIQIERSSPSC